MVTDKEYLEFILKGFLTQPNDLVVERSEDDMGILLTVAVSKNDMGRVIGENGRTSKAIRHILNSFGYNAKEKVSVKILEPKL